MRYRGSRLRVLAAFTAIVTVAVGIPVNIVTGYLPATLKPLWICLAVGLTLLAGALAFYQDGPKPVQVRLWPVPSTAGWVERPELRRVVAALTSPGTVAVAVTTGLVGAGGFGKTMLAARVCQERQVQRIFPSGVCWVTAGQELAGPALADRINDAVIALGGAERAATVEGAAQALASVMASRPGRMLLVADDIWTAEQMAAFAVAGQGGRLLVTTRRPSLLKAASVSSLSITVDAMPQTVARQLLTQGLPQLPAKLERELLNRTAGYPLLLGLVNRQLADDLVRGSSIADAAAYAAKRLALAGPGALDIADASSRANAIAATVDYSLRALDPADRSRFFELSVFAEDAEVPQDVIAMLWEGTAGLHQEKARVLTQRLADLSLLSLAGPSSRRVVITHDVIREFAAGRLGPDRARAAHGVLISSARKLSDLHDADGSAGWWKLPETAAGTYLQRNLAYHLAAADAETELDQLCHDLRFLSVRLCTSGTAGVEADLARSSSATAGRLCKAISQNAHLLRPTEPPWALATIFTSRLGSIPEVAGQLPALRSSLGVWTAWPEWRLPDEPSDQLLRTITGHGGEVRAIAIAFDGDWLATAANDGTVRVWGADGTLRATLRGHRGVVHGVAIAPDSSWLATAGGDGTLRIWGADGSLRARHSHDRPATAVAISPDGSWLASASGATVWTWNADGTPRARLYGHEQSVTAVAIAPNGDWLASASYDRSVRTWYADGSPRTTLRGHVGGVIALAIAPDGSWLADADSDEVLAWQSNDHSPGFPRPIGRNTYGDVTNHARAVAIAPDGGWIAVGGSDGMVRTWGTDGKRRATLYGHDGEVTAVAIAPDGSWLASTGVDGTARIWRASPHDLTSIDTASGHGEPVADLAIAPDGTWWASAAGHGKVGRDKTVRIWNADGSPRAVLHGHDSSASAVAIAPDGRWLVSGGSDDTVRIWGADGSPRAVLRGHDGPVTAVAIAPDGSWLVSGAGLSDDTVRIWGADGSPRAVLRGHDGPVTAVAIAPDGSWLVSAGSDATVRIWEAEGSPRAVLHGHDGWIPAVAIAPDGSWLVSGGNDATVRIWDADGSPRVVLRSHDGPVTAVAIAPDGSWLVSASRDRTARIWDNTVDRQTTCITLIRVSGPLSACAFAAAGSRLYLAGYRGNYVFSLGAPDETRVRGQAPHHRQQAPDLCGFALARCVPCR